MSGDGMHRVLTVTWEDPRVSRRDAAAVSGLDYLAALKEGRVPQPPAARLLGYRIRDVERGRTVFELEPAEHHYNPFATVHGGIMATLLDTAMTAAVLSALEVGVACATLEMKVNFVRAVTAETGALRCEGKVIHLGTSIATAEGRLLDGRGRLCAHALTTCSVFPAAGPP
ncbi:MAG TPA: PaaI family thioesterase [Anaeromyxobacteraceae bacterium]